MSGCLTMTAVALAVASHQVHLLVFVEWSSSLPTPTHSPHPMSVSSGISVSKALEDAFASARSKGAGARLLETTIEGEQFVLAAEVAAGKVRRPQREVFFFHHGPQSAQDDWALLEQRVQPKQPRIFLFRLDDQGAAWGYGLDDHHRQRAHGRVLVDAALKQFTWAFISYVPDGSPVRSRMLFASSRDTVRKTLGYSYFSVDVEASSASDLTWDSFVAAKTAKLQPVTDDVLTEKERTVARMSRAEVDTGGANSHAVRFPASDELKAALQALAAGATINLVQMSLDLQRETIELADSATVEPAQLASKVSTTDPRFSVYCYRHEHDGAEVASHVFVYSCPDAAAVKARMLYSTVKSVAIDVAAAAGIAVDAKLEIQDADEWQEELMTTTLHPAAVKLAAAVSRPRPAGRGPRRQIK